MKKSTEGACLRVYEDRRWTMVDQFMFGSEFFALLEQEDERIAGQVAAAGCAVCGGPLYRGDYDRKPCGARIVAGAEASVRRFSLCCGREGCRRRATRRDPCRDR